MSKNPYLLRWLQSTPPDNRSHVIDDFKGQLESLQEHGVLDETVKEVFNQLVYCNPCVLIQPLQGNKKNHKRTNKNHEKEGIKKRKTEEFNLGIAILKEDKNKTSHNGEERKIKLNNSNDKLKEKVKHCGTEIRINKPGDERNSKRKIDLAKVTVKSRSTNDKVAPGKSDEINKPLEECRSGLSGDVFKIKTHRIIKHKISDSIKNCNKSKSSSKKYEHENVSNYDKRNKKRDYRTLGKSRSPQIPKQGSNNNKQDFRKSNDLNKNLKGCKGNTNNDLKKIRNEITRHVESSLNKNEKIYPQEETNQIIIKSNRIPEQGDSSNKEDISKSNDLNTKFKGCKSNTNNNDLKNITNEISRQVEPSRNKTKKINPQEESNQNPEFINGGTGSKNVNKNPNEINKKLKECKNKIGNNNVQKTKNKLKQDESKSVIKDQSSKPSEIIFKCKENIKIHQENISHGNYTKNTELKGTEQCNAIQGKRTEEEQYYKKHDGCRKKNFDFQIKDKKIKSETQIKSNKKKEDKMGRKKNHNDKANIFEENNEIRNKNITNIAKKSRQLQSADEPDYTRLTPSLTPSECNDIWADQGLAPPQLQARTIWSVSKTTHPAITEVAVTMPPPRQPALTTAVPVETQCIINAPIEVIVGRLDQLSPITQLVPPLKREFDLASRQFEERHCAEKQELYNLDEALLPAIALSESSAVISAPTTDLVPLIKTELVRNISLKNDTKTENLPPVKQDLMKRNLLLTDSKHTLRNLKTEPGDLDEALLPVNSLYESSAVISAPTKDTLVPLIKTELVRNISLKNERKTELLPPEKQDFMGRNSQILRNLMSEPDDVDEALLPVNSLLESSAVISAPTTDTLVPLIKTELVRNISLKNERKTELLLPENQDLMGRNSQILRNLMSDTGRKVDAETPILQLLASLNKDVLKKAKQEPLLPINTDSYFNLFSIYNLYLNSLGPDR